MNENVETPGPMDAEPAPSSRDRRGVFWRVVYPLLVIAAIVAVIWWIDYRPGGSDSPTGERYGAVELPAALVPAGAQVKAEAGSLAPDFLLGGLNDGEEIRLSGYRGHPVVLNFWATWCAPCRKEIPNLVAVYGRHKDAGLVVIGLNHAEGRSIITPFVEKFGMDFPIAVDLDGEMWSRYRLLGLPTTFFIDGDGVVRSVFLGPFVEESGGTNVQGAIEESELEKRIAEIVAPSPGAGGQ